MYFWILGNKNQNKRFQTCATLFGSICYFRKGLSHSAELQLLPLLTRPLPLYTRPLPLYTGPLPLHTRLVLQPLPRATASCRCLELFDGSDELRERGVLKVPAVGVAVELCLEVVGHLLLLLPGQEGVVRGAELDQVTRVARDA